MSNDSKIETLEHIRTLQTFMDAVFHNFKIISRQLKYGLPGRHPPLEDVAH